MIANPEVVAEKLQQLKGGLYRAHDALRRAGDFLCADRVVDGDLAYLLTQVQYARDQLQAVATLAFNHAPEMQGVDVEWDDFNDCVRYRTV